MCCISDLRGRLAVPNDDLYEIEGVVPDYRRIPLSRSTHMRGWYPVREGHPAVAFESRLECRVISVLARYPQTVLIKSQPVTIFYRHDGRAHRYTPDLLVQLSEVPLALKALGFEALTFVEVKPQRRAIEAEGTLRRQFNVVRQATGHAVALVTDWDLLPDETEERLYGF
ncbi:hypothetical protein J5226_02095 [Lysobacter sp. K5869]|uniref:hypothetical protein n=1 Tax=Lysobacter sp. K5869 TaxID=2820808 RepID=UPI001C062AC6|nr:hypothetical protein [Lysobacter sp. K5869]QWP77219.1 hypothetical protein J5226_02095 [Lysobacter sp. K5869]